MYNYFKFKEKLLGRGQEISCKGFRYFVVLCQSFLWCWCSVFIVRHFTFCGGTTRLFLIRNLTKGLVLKVPYFRTSFCQILVLKVP